MLRIVASWLANFGCATEVLYKKSTAIITDGIASDNLLFLNLMVGAILSETFQIKLVSPHDI